MSPREDSVQSPMCRAPLPLRGRSSVLATGARPRHPATLTQIVGKVRMANEPLVNHWWNVPLYVSARGLTTSLMSHPSGLGFETEFDFSANHLVISTSNGSSRTMPLQAGPVGGFLSQLMGLLDELGVSTRIWPVPVEIPGAVAFADDKAHTIYDPEQADSSGSCS